MTKSQSKVAFSNRTKVTHHDAKNCKKVVKHNHISYAMFINILLLTIFCSDRSALVCTRALYLASRSRRVRSNERYVEHASKRDLKMPGRALSQSRSKSSHTRPSKMSPRKHLIFLKGLCSQREAPVLLTRKYRRG